MRLKKIKIGGQVYKVITDNEICTNFNALGVTFKDKSLIVLKDDAPDDVILDTLIHEMLHGVCANYLFDPERADEEEIVTALAHGLTQVLRDNPKLLQQIQELI